MRIVFMGTPAFACPSLEALRRSERQVVLVVTRTDKPRGRSGKPMPPEVKRLAWHLGLSALQPEDVNAPDALAAIRLAAPDLIVTAAFGQKLGAELLSIPKRGSINVHASLLPKYRGAAPINWAIIRGETETGITIFRMAERLDAGEIISQTSTPIHPDETAGELSERLAALAAELLLKTIGDIEAGHAACLPQDPQAATRAPILKKEDGAIDWSRPAREIRNFVRGMTPWPGAFTFLSTPQEPNPLRILILKVEVVSGDIPVTSPPGVVTRIGPDQIEVATGQGLLNIVRLKPAGGRELGAGEFLHGHALKPGDRFVSKIA